MSGIKGRRTDSKADKKPSLYSQALAYQILIHCL
ncbi:hypothetical protein CECT5772_09897 [Streptococcus equi subsp. ruminatorum CECT 5772]|uniref:Uncharacterized protein n=1 Tax=Streptococcus equi subsp. ruminatorum CECT 5772 TaxID=1051981 RepID=A0A922NSV3_9STRE|nr:hypothetical protein CECT5772_09897 [Streptococcus equi subsp. ruminatorum CECT 5772]